MVVLQPAPITPCLVTAASPLLPSRLHDFGMRGCATLEQTVLGGSAHLLSFDGSDTMSAAYYVQAWVPLPGLCSVSMPLRGLCAFPANFSNLLSTVQMHFVMSCWGFLGFLELRLDDEV
jgi:hypothetical protein